MTRSPTAVAGDQLTVEVDDGSGTVTTWTLLCEAGPDGTTAVGGDHPDVAGACTAVTERAAAFAPVPKDRVCTMIYGGPQTARVTGTWAGATIDSSFKRTNGCEIARWNRMAALLQPGVPTSSGSGAV
ncbi:SSI family serine proteinase inhibitor [Kineococcus gynurae]|uniref:SSI family serine proteinase inhibitor n=1 Tax=Kineococcus gynurae TaxID=452979 RepID=A0ABV5LSS2_9ACTN